MAIASLLLSLGQIAALNAVLGSKPYRGLVGSLAQASDSIGATGSTDYNIQFDVVMEEQHTDDLEITDHPVQQGAAVTDNAYKKPAMVVLQCGVSQSGGGELTYRTSDFINKFYNFLLSIQLDRTPFTVYTGKRVYQNMLLKSVATHTNDDSEYSLPLTLVCRQIIIAQTAAVTVTTDQTIQTMPENTTPTVNAGNKQLAPAPLYTP